MLVFLVIGAVQLKKLFYMRQKNLMLENFLSALQTFSINLTIRFSFAASKREEFTRSYNKLLRQKSDVESSALCLN